MRIAAVAAIAATGLMAGVAVTATTHLKETHVHVGTNETHTDFATSTDILGPGLVGISANGID